MYEKGSLAIIIDDQGLNHVIPIDMVPKYIAEGKCTVKVEGLEDHVDLPFDPGDTYTVHAYIAPEGGPSFPEHKDPYPVWIYCIEGQKDMEIRGIRITLKAGDFTMIPTNVPHRALNYKASVMLSIGLENAT